MLFLRTVPALALISLAIPLGAQAACIGAVCTDAKVIDQFERVGKVTAIAGDQVTYTIAGGMTSTASASQLSPEVSQYKNIKRGEYIADQFDRVGLALAVFANGQVQYKFNGMEAVSATVSPETSPVGAGQLVVIDQFDRVGPALHVFEDGRIQYSMSSELTAVSATLSPAVSSLNGISTNTTIVDQFDRVGSTLYAFKDGRVQYTISGGITAVSKDVFGEVASIGKLRAGNDLIDQFDRVGVTAHVFKDGRAEYSISGGISVVSKEVSPEIEAVGTDRDIRKGVSIADQFDRIGTVDHVFESQKVSYTLAGNVGAISSADVVSPEVSSNPKYSKDTEYAIDAPFVGKAERFFKDGRVDLVSDAYALLTRVLYAQVNQLDGYTAGAQVVPADGSVGPVTLVFANGVVQYQHTFADPNTHKQYTEKKPARIFGIDAKNVENDEVLWIVAVGFNILNSEVINSRDDMVTLQVTYPTVKTELLARLNKQPGIINDPSIRSKVIAFLSK